METKYKILWLDDDFAEQDAFIGKDENESRSIFHDDVNLSSEWGFDIVGVKNLEEFKSELSRVGAYQAVILDLRGMTSEGEVDEYVAHDALELLEETKKLPVYVYSANTNMPYHEGFLRKIKKAGRAFRKSDGVEVMYDRILSDLDDNLHFYEDHRECLKLFQNGFLDATKNRSVMDEIMRHHKEKDLEYSPYNPMRQILEDMLENLKKVKIFIGLTKIKGNLKEVQTFNSAIKHITRDCHLKEGKKEGDRDAYDYLRPLIPLNIMRQDVKYTLSFLSDMANNFSHYIKEHPGFITTDESIRMYNALMQEATYDSFFIVMRWYYAFMSHIRLEKFM